MLVGVGLPWLPQHLPLARRGILRGGLPPRSSEGGAGEGMERGQWRGPNEDVPVRGEVRRESVGGGWWQRKSKLGEGGGRKVKKKATCRLARGVESRESCVERGEERKKRRRVRVAGGAYK